MSILYVDDDPEDIEIFRDAVVAVDSTVRYITCTNANDALNFLDTADTLPDYLILDMNMPGMDGKLCLHEIRKNEQLRDLSVIVYSTNSFPKDIEEIESLNATFIKKANSFNDLCDMIRNLISDNRTER